MSEALEKSVRNYKWCVIVLGIISFLYGGIYTEMIVEQYIEFTLWNILIALICGFLVAAYISIPIFLFSLVIFHIKEKRKKQKD